MPEKAKDLLCISFVHHKGKYNWKIQFCKILPHVSSHPLCIHILSKSIGGIFQFQCHIISPRWNTYIYSQSQSSEITILVFGEWILLKGETLKLNLRFKFTNMKILEILSVSTLKRSKTGNFKYVSIQVCISIF